MNSNYTKRMKTDDAAGARRVLLKRVVCFTRQLHARIVVVRRLYDAGARRLFF